jgi:hypothetical protein
LLHGHLRSRHPTGFFPDACYASSRRSL